MARLANPKKHPVAPISSLLLLRDPYHLHPSLPFISRDSSAPKTCRSTSDRVDRGSVIFEWLERCVCGSSWPFSEGQNPNGFGWPFNMEALKKHGRPFNIYIYIWRFSKALKPYHRHGGSTVCPTSREDWKGPKNKLEHIITVFVCLGWGRSNISIFTYIYIYIYNLNIYVSQNISTYSFHNHNTSVVSQVPRSTLSSFPLPFTGPFTWTMALSAYHPLHEMQGEWSYRSSYDEDLTSHLTFQWKPPKPRIAWRIWWFQSLATIFVSKNSCENQWTSQKNQTSDL